MSTVYVVFSPGGQWSNDDEAKSGVAGLYSTQGKAYDAIRDLMLNELNAVDAGEPETLAAMSFLDLQELWSETTDTDPYVVIWRDLDVPLLDVHAAGDF